MNLLILEDDISSQETFKETFNFLGINIFQAFDLKEAEEIFDKEKDNLDMIALDGQVPTKGSRFKDTRELAKFIKANFNKIVVSISLSSDIRNEFKAIGLEILQEKFNLLDKVMSVKAELEKNFN